MSEMELLNNAQITAPLAGLLNWLGSMSSSDRRKFLGALAECSDSAREVVIAMIDLMQHASTTEAERKRASTTIADALFPRHETDGGYGQDLVESETVTAAVTPLLAREVQKMDSQEAEFANRLRAVMDSRRMSQQELASRAGCSQPAISQMLNRNCRPQKRTILKIAEALGVTPCDLWPDIEVVEMLDSVAAFCAEDYTMSEAEARWMNDSTRTNRLTRPVKSLPTRKRT